MEAAVYYIMAPARLVELADQITYLDTNFDVLLNTTILKLM